MLVPPRRPDWCREGIGWPNRAASRFVSAGGIEWHVQCAGQGPPLLLLHGTGAATHSWRDLIPKLAADFAVVAPDLPGHGFTEMPGGDGLTLPGMSARLATLLRAMGVVPAAAAGHSAGAAILVAMALERRIAPKLIVSINGALRPIRGAGLFSPLAKLLFLNPLAPRLFSWRAHAGGATARLLEGTGSRLDARGVALYERLFRTPGHVAATLGMMAGWDVEELPRRLRELDRTRLVLVATAGDRAVPPADAAALARGVPGARAVLLPAGGHLAHEEDPQAFAALIRGEACAAGIL